jgi:hypothetical protein
MLCVIYCCNTLPPPLCVNELWGATILSSRDSNPPSRFDGGTTYGGSNQKGRLIPRERLFRGGKYIRKELGNRVGWCHVALPKMYIDIQVHFHFSNSFSLFQFVFTFPIHFHFSNSFSFFKIIFNLWNHFQNNFNFWIYFQLGFNIRIDYQFVFKSNLVIDFWKKNLEKVFVSYPILSGGFGHELAMKSSPPFF